MRTAKPYGSIPAIHLDSKELNIDSLHYRVCVAWTPSYSLDSRCATYAVYRSGEANPVCSGTVSGPFATMKAAESEAYKAGQVWIKERCKDDSRE